LKGLRPSAALVDAKGRAGLIKRTGSTVRSAICAGGIAAMRYDALWPHRYADPVGAGRRSIR